MAKYTRDLSKYSPDERETYQNLFNETQQLFLEKAEKVTVVHTMIIDRFVSTYLDLLSLDDVKIVSEKKYNQVQTKFQSWAKTIMETLHSVGLETESRRAFYEKVRDIMTEEIPDDKLRKYIFERILKEALSLKR